MVLQPLASFALRPRRGKVILVGVLALLMVVGCSHRRSSLRPVYVGPAPAVVPGPAVVEPAPLEAAPVSPPSTYVEPSSAPPLDVPSAQPAPSLEASPPRPRATPGEPMLELNPPNEAPSASPGASLRGPRPSTLRYYNNIPPQNANGQRSGAARTRQASLRDRLRPFANDPDDLFTPPKADRPWKYVVLHHSAHASGSYAEIDREHRKVLGWDGCGYHFIIGNGTGSPDGQVEVAQRWTNQKNGVHCRDGKTTEVNEYGIGICLVGDLDAAAPTPRQIEAAQALVAYLSARYNIPADHIGRHTDLAVSPTACPGRLFPAQAILDTRSYAQR